jgi:hypothetical protein
MGNQIFIYWDDWKDQIIKKEIPEHESIKFSKSTAEKEETS